MRKDLLSQGFKRIKVKNTYGQTLKTHPFMYKTDKYSFIKTNDMQIPSGILTNINPTVAIIGTLLPNTQYRLTFELDVQLDSSITGTLKSIQHIDSLVFQTVNSANATLYHKYFTLTVVSIGGAYNPQIEFTVSLLNAQRLKITGLEAITVISGEQKLKQDIIPIISSAPTFSTQRMGGFYDSNKSEAINNVCKINGMYVIATSDRIITNDMLKNTDFSNSNWTVIRSSIETHSLLYNYHNDTVVAIYNCDKPETTRVIVSSDGITWNEYSPGFRIWHILDAKDNKGYFVSTSTTSVTEPTIYYTEDFITFTATNITSFNDNLMLNDGEDIIYFEGKYYIAFEGLYLDNGVITSDDGITWKKTSFGYSHLFYAVLTGQIVNNSNHAYALIRAGTYDPIPQSYKGESFLAYTKTNTTNWTRASLSIPFEESRYIYPFSKGVLIFSYKSDTEHLFSIYTHDSSENLIGSYQRTTTDADTGLTTITDIMEIPSTNEYPVFLILSGSKVYVLEYSTEASSSVLRTVLELQESALYEGGIQMVNGLYIIKGYYSQDARTWVPVSDLFMADGWEEDEDGVGTDIVLKALIKLTDKVMIPIKQGVCHGDLTLIHCDQTLPGYSEVKTYDQL